MRVSFKKNLVRLFFFLFVFPIANSFAASNDLFKIEFLPTVPTPQGNFDRALRWMDMNDSGQVTGHAWGSAIDAQAGILYTPGKGMKLIDPSGSLMVEPWRINNKGQIVGHDFGSAQYSLFLYDPQKGYQSLLKGSLRPHRYGLHDMNNQGVIMASSQIVKGVSRPIRYTPGRGWEDLINTVPALNRFNENPFSVFATHINENGDFTFYLEHSYVYYAKSDKVVELSPMHPPSSDLNDFGWVAGTAFELTKPPVIGPINERPYLYIPGVGMRNIHPKIKGEMEALWIAADGTVGGCVSKLNCQSLFTYNSQEGHKIVDAELFRKMLPSDMPFDGIGVHSMNDRKEFVGSVDTHDDDPLSLVAGAYFWYSPRHGLKDLGKVVDQLEKNLKIEQIEDFNNAGQILLQVTRDGNSGAAILTPTN